MEKKSLCLHSGAKSVSIDVVRNVETPLPTSTWQPIPHSDIIDRSLSALSAIGLTPVREEHALGQRGNRYFGLFDMVNGSNAEDHGLVVGLRNSHDKSFPAGFVVGDRVFICDNLSFSGEVQFARKHTKNIYRDLSQLVTAAVGRLTEARKRQDIRIDAYRDMNLTDMRVHDIVIRALDARVIGSQRVPDVIAEYRTPHFDEFKSRTAWSLFNAFTYILKDTNKSDLSKRTMALHGLFDGMAGLVLPTLASN